MADVMYPVANGNWTNAANWTSDTPARVGTKPAAGDTVVANNKTVTVDESTAALALLTNIATGGAAGGGSFEVSAATVTITATDISSSSVACLKLTATNAYTVTLAFTRLLGATGTNVSAVTHSGTCTVNSSGDIYAGTFATGIFGTYHQTASSVWNHTGDFYATISSTTRAAYIAVGTANIAGYVKTLFTGIHIHTNGTLNLTNSQRVYCGSALYNIINYGVCNITGDLSGGLIAGEIGNVVYNAGSLTLTGNITGTSISGGIAIIQNNSTTAIGTTVIGNITGGTTKEAILNAAASVKLFVTGNVTAGTNNPAIHSGSITAGTVVNDIVGNITASATSSAIKDGGVSYATTTKVNGNMVNVSNLMAVFTYYIQVHPSAVMTWIMQDTDGVDRTFYTNPSGFPAESDVRKDQTYGEADEFTGTLAVPTAAQVFKDVPIDDTVGTFEALNVNYSAIADIVGEIVANNFP